MGNFSKKFRSFQSNTLFATALTGMLFAACGDNKVKYTGRTAASVDIQNPAITGGGSPGSEDAVAAVNSEDVLKGLLEKEREERIAEDQRLNQRIDELAGQLGALSQLVSSEIQRLDESDAAILVQLADTEAKLRVELNALNTQIGQLSDETQEKIQELLQADADLKEELSKTSFTQNLIIGLSDDEITQLKEIAEGKNVEANTARINESMAGRAGQADLFLGEISKSEETKTQLVTLLDLEVTRRDRLKKIESDIGEINTAMALNKAAAEAALAGLATKVGDIEAELKTKIEETQAALDKTKTELQTQLDNTLKAVLTPEQLTAIEDLKKDIQTIQTTRSEERVTLIKKIEEAKAAFAEIKDDYDPKFVENKKKLEEAEKALELFDAETSEMIAEAEKKITDYMEEKSEADEAAKQEVIDQFKTLNDTITKIEEDRAAAEEKITSDYKAAIASESKALKDQMNDDKAELTDKINDDTAALKALLITEMQSGQDDMFQKMAEMQEATDDYRASAIADSEDKANQIEQLRKALQAQADELIAFKEYAANTYATKAELELVKEAVAGLDAVTKTLGKEIDKTSEEFQAALTAQDIALRDTLMTEISSVRADVKSLRTDFTNHVKSYLQTVSGLKKELSDKFRYVMDRVMGVRGEMIARDNAMNAQMQEELHRMAIRYQSITTDLKKQLNDKIYMVNQRIDVTNAELVAAKEDAQRQLNDAMVISQTEREDLQKELAMLTSEMERIAKETAANTAMNAALAKRVSTIEKTLDEHIADTAKRFDLNEAEVNTLKTDFAAFQNEVNAKIKEVQDEAREMVADLGEDTQEQFGKMAAEMADLSNRTDGVAKSVLNLATEYRSSVAHQEKIENEVMPAQKALTQEGLSLVDAMEDVYRSAMDAIQPNQETAHKDAYNVSFKPIAQLCGGNTETSFASVDGRDSFEYLALEYIQLLVKGVPAVYNQKVFFGKAGPIDMASFSGMAALAVLDYNVASEAHCKKSISNWGRSILIGGSSTYTTMMSRFANSKELERNVGILVSKLKAFDVKAKELEALYKKYTNDKMPMDEIAAALRQAVAIKYAAMSRETFMQKIVETQKQFAADQNQSAADVEAKFAALNKKINDFANKIQKQADNNSKGLAEAFRLIATIAKLQGLDGAVDAAVTAAKIYTGYTIAPIKDFTPKISMVQHYFTPPATRNWSNACIGTSVVVRESDYMKNQRSCWVNFRRQPMNTWTHASKVKFRVFGSATRVAVKEAYSSTYNFDFRTPTNKHSIRTGQFQWGVFDMSDERILMPYIQRATSNFTQNWGASAYWGGAKLQLTPYNDIAIDPAKKSGKTQLYTIRLYSPLVLDFNNVGSLITSENKGMMFDINGDGIKETTGWVKGSQGGFLALDLNKNGSIDDGKELFGEATDLVGTKTSAGNGYKALAQYDINKDGHIDAKDPIFDDLVVWFDHNENGVSEKSELKSLEDVKVSKIGVEYAETSEANRWDKGNELRYQAKFYGPEECGVAGCTSYDVYFNTGFLLGNK